MGGLFCLGQSKKEEIKQPVHKKPQIEKVDEVKFKLKKARDTIKNFVNAKNKDLKQLQDKIAEKVPAFKETGNKKELIPLLKAKKDIMKMVESGEVRLKLVNEKLDEVEMQKINAETIDVLEESNKYVREIQEQLEKKDWRNVLDEAQQKYEIEWPEAQPEENDPAFQKMWKQLGGDKIAAKGNQQKTVQKKTVKVQIAKQPKEVVHEPKQLQEA